MKTLLSHQLQHHLTLTPLLSQAISLLQLSHYDLYEEIQKIVDTNPMLEVHYPLGHPYNDHDFFLNTPDKSIHSLRHHLHHQLVLMHYHPHLYNLGCFLIDSLNEQGFLDSDFLDQLPNYERETLSDWLHQLDPVGIGARNVTECLYWQLLYREDIKKNPLSNQLIKIINLSFENPSFDIHAYKKFLKLSNEDFYEITNIFNKLVFNPAEDYENRLQLSPQHYPDLIVYKKNNMFCVRLNEELLPLLKVHGLTGTSSKNKNIKELYQQAKYFLKIMNTRFETLIKTAQVIVNHQQDFFYHGKSRLKPLILEDIAQELGLHESTISRIITNKFIETPSGMLELKTLLARSIKKKSGESASTVAVKEMIDGLITHEDKFKPLSDQMLANILVKQGFCIARRTVAKYREQLSIQDSTKRKNSNHRHLKEDFL